MQDACQASGKNHRELITKVIRNQYARYEESIMQWEGAALSHPVSHCANMTQCE